MDKNSSNKSRRERRKEAHLSKNQKKYDSWVQHQNLSKVKKMTLQLNSEKVLKLEKDEQHKQKGEVNLGQSDKDIKDVEPQMQEKSEGILRDLKRKNGSRKGLKTKFNEYLELEMKGQALSVKEDLELERKLAKKLKVKSGKLRGADDDIDMLLEGIPSVLSDLEENGQGIERSLENSTLHRKHKIKELADIKSKSEKLFNNVDEESDALEDTNDNHDDVEEVVLHENSKKANRRKTNFEEYLMIEMQGGDISGEADLALEKKLGKKLRVKEGRLRGENDGINMLFSEIPSVLDSREDEIVAFDEDPQASLDSSCSGENTDQEKRAEGTVDSSLVVSRPVKPSGAEGAIETVCNVVPGKYVAPHLRSLANNESEEYAQIRRQIRGLLNRLSESNLESTTREISTVLKSVSRSAGSQIIHEEVVASFSRGPRGNEQHAAVFAALVAGMACLVGIDFGAKLLACLAKCFEKGYLEEDKLSLHNLALFLSYLYIFGVCPSDLVYDFLIMLSKRLTEVDVEIVLKVLEACGMKLRGDDPLEMKNFILSIQSRVNEMKVASGDAQSYVTSKKMGFMLEFIFDIKNNKKRQKENAVQHTRIKKWLQQLGVVDILIRGLKWSKLLDPNKKGQWWLSGDIGSSAQNIENVASSIDREVPEAQKLLQLAAAQKMNTDARRAIFCVIMSGEDYVDAFEKLLRLDLPGKLDREIIRVLVECCLQEKVFNKYYCVLASQLCNHDKNFKFTLQFCVWDHFRQLEAMEVQRSMHLSKFVAEMVASFGLSLAVLKVVDLNNPVLLTPKRIMHFRMLLKAILEFPDKVVWSIFTRIAIAPEYESLRIGIDFFVRNQVLGEYKFLADKYKLAKKALNNVEGVLM